MECSVFNSRVFFGTIAAGVLAAGIAVPAIAATPAYSPVSHVKSTVGSATIPVSGAVPGGASLPKGLTGGAPAAGPLGGLGLTGLPVVTSQRAGHVRGTSAPGGTNGQPAMNNPDNHVTSVTPGQASVPGTTTSPVNGAKTSIGGRDPSDVLKSLPLVGSLTGNLPALAP